jgi:hypothetical protein
VGENDPTAISLASASFNCSWGLTAASNSSRLRAGGRPDRGWLRPPTIAAFPQSHWRWSCWRSIPAYGAMHNIGRVGSVRGRTFLQAQDNRAPTIGKRLLFLTRANLGVWTMSTDSASDRVVLRSDRPGFRTFPPLPSVCKGWNAVRVPPRARVFPGQGPVSLRVCTNCSHEDPPGALCVGGRCCGRQPPCLLG